jgi:hypothetical protein
MSLDTRTLGVMSSDQFTNRTNASNAVGGFKSRFKSRGSALAQIDHVLKAWERSLAGNASTSERLARINDVVVETTTYLTNKSASGKSTPLADARGQVVAELRHSAIKARSYMSNKVKAEGRSHGGPAQRAQLKALEPGYAHERTHYLVDGKGINPYAGSAIEEQAPGQLGGMGFVEFVNRGHQLEIGPDRSRVEYLDRKQRMEHLLVIDGGRFTRDGSPVNLAQGNAIWADTYAMDRYGNIFSKEFQMGDAFFNHSSYCAGKEILCAGTIGIVNGVLVYFSNLSGHYKPSAASLREALIVIGGEGVNLQDVMIDDKQHGRTLRGSTLVANPGSASDWPHLGRDRGHDNTPMPIYQGALYSLRNPA